MGLANYGELKASIASWSARSDLTTSIPDFIFWAHEEISRRLRCNSLLTSTTLTIDAETKDLPTRFAAVKRFYLDVTPRISLTVASAEALADMAATSGTCTYPTHVAVEGANFRFGPLFTGSATGRLLYYQSPALMTAAADTNVILTKYPFLYLYGALEALFRFMEDDNNADRYGAQFGALIEDINSREARDVMSGPLQARAGAGAVV